MTRYRIDPGRSHVETLMTSNVHPIHAKAQNLSGVIEGELDADGKPDFGRPHRARIHLPVEALASGNRIQDLEMQRRMEARKHPSIDIDVKRAWSHDGNGSGGSRAAFEVQAKGQSRPYEEDFSMRAEGNRLVIEGEHRFDMRDFGVNPPRFFTLKVDPEVTVKVRIEAEEDKTG